MNPLVESVLEKAVVRSFDDIETEVEGMSERVETNPLRGLYFFEGEVALRRNFRLHDREIVRHVDVQDLDRDRLLVVPGCEARAVPIGMLHYLGDDVVVGDEMTLGADEKAGADRGLRRGADFLNLDFNDAVREAPEYFLGRRDLEQGRGERDGPEVDAESVERSEHSGFKISEERRLLAGAGLYRARDLGLRLRSREERRAR